MFQISKKTAGFSIVKEIMVVVDHYGCVGNISLVY